MQASGFTFQERPPITKKECSFQKNDLTIAEEIQGKLIFFSKLKILQQFMTEIQEQEKIINQITDVKLKLQVQNKIIQDGLIDKFKWYRVNELTEFKANKNPGDPQVVECYNNILLLNKKLLQVIQSVKNCGDFYETSFDSLIQNKFDNIKLLINNLNLIQDYKQEDIQKEIDQLSRDYQICSGNYFLRINNLQQRVKINKNQQKQLQLYEKNNQKDVQKNLQQNLLQSNWEFKQYEPVKIKDCRIQFDRIEENFLQFLKIQEIFDFIKTQKEQNDLINNFYKFKENFQKNNKLIHQGVLDINWKTVEVIKFQRNQYHNTESNDVNSAYQEYSNFQNQLNRALNSIKSVKELSDRLDDNIFQDIYQLNIKINEFIQSKFTYQQRDVYKELKQINRDYNLCKHLGNPYGGNPYEKFIEKYVERTVSFTREPLLENLSPDQKSKCQNLFDIKQNILKAQKNLVLIQYKKEGHNYFHRDQRPVLRVQELFKEINLSDTVVEFQNYLPNYKPDDIWAVKAFQRLQIINKLLVNLKKNKNNANYFLYQINGDYKKLEEYSKELNKYVNELSQNEAYIQKQLDDLQSQYTICTGNYFNDVYQIEKDPRSSQLNKIQIELNDKKANKKSKREKIHANTQKQSLIQYSWQYNDYSEQSESECEDDLNQIKEDILELHKIQVLFQYKNKYQKQYNELIAKILAIELDFVETAPQVIKQLEYEEKEFQFARYPRNDDDKDLIPKTYRLLEKVDKKIAIINQQKRLAKDFFKFNQIDFSSIRYNNRLLNEYLDHDFKHQESDVEKELIQLYRDYKICQEKDYDEDTDDQKQIQHNAQKKHKKVNSTELQ